MTSFYETAFQIICSMALGTSAPSPEVMTSAIAFEPASQLIQQVAAPTQSPEAAAVQFARQAPAQLEVEPSTADPLPAPKVNAAPGFPGASEIYAFNDSANRILKSRPVQVKRGKAVKEIDLAEVITDSAREHGIDPLIVEIVIKHESAFDPEACSGVGASGLMQLMPETARDLGVTDITDPAQNIQAGTKYLAQQYRHYGNLHLALAAYNAGPGNVDYYGGVPPFDETQNYASSIASEYKQRRMLR